MHDLEVIRFVAIEIITSQPIMVVPGEKALFSLPLYS